MAYALSETTHPYPIIYSFQIRKIEDPKSPTCIGANEQINHITLMYHSSVRNLI